MKSPLKTTKPKSHRVSRRCFDRALSRLLESELQAQLRPHLAAAERFRRHVVADVARRLKEHNFTWPTIGRLLGVSTATCWRWAQGDRYRQSQNLYSRLDYAARRSDRATNPVVALSESDTNAGDGGVPA